MNLNHLILLGILLASTLSPIKSATAIVFNQSDSSESVSIAQEVGPPEQFLDPVATVNPEQPIQVRVINASEIDVDIATVFAIPKISERVAAPGESVTFGRLHTSYLPPPLEFEIYITGQDLTLDDPELVVENNEIIVTVSVRPGVARSAVGIRVVDSGEIYVF